MVATDLARVTRVNLLATQPPSVLSATLVSFPQGGSQASQVTASVGSRFVQEKDTGVQGPVAAAGNSPLAFSELQGGPSGAHTSGAGRTHPSMQMEGTLQP